MIAMESCSHACRGRAELRAGMAMAIKFVDNEPEDVGKPKRSEQADTPTVKREPDAEALSPSVDPELSHAKPAAKKRGRK